MALIENTAIAVANATAARPSQDDPMVDLLHHEQALDALAGVGGSAAKDVPQEVWERALYGPLREFLSRPGKRFRARMVSAAWALGGGDPGTMPRELPLLVEMLHSGSLIVDDIEDGSETRRGAPALHRTWGVPVALNAGNWLYFWPFVVLERMALPAQTRLALMGAMSRTLAAAHKGQALDVSVRIGSLRQRDVRAVVEATTRLKTGCLMDLAARLGAAAAGASPQRLEAIATFGRDLGIGLQMLDDLGGITSPRRRHKGLEDLSQGRPTWPWAWAAEDVDELTFAQLQKMSRAVTAGEAPPEPLAERLAELLNAHPGHPMLRVRRHGRNALDTLARQLGPHPVIDALMEEIQRLEASYD